MPTSKPSLQIRRALVILAALLIAVCAWVPAIQQLADAQVDAGLKRALITFASARALNAVISVIQGTELSVQPLGVGITLTFGQVLDPINDLVEQFSTLMLVVSVVFGIQKLLLVIGSHWLISLTVTGFALAWAALMWLGKSTPWMSRVMLVLLMIRFAIPVVTLGSDFVFRQVLAKDYAESQKILDTSAKQVKDLTPQAPTSDKAEDASGNKGKETKAEGAAADEVATAQKKSLWAKMKEGVAAKLPAINVNFDAARKTLESVPERVITLIVIFVAQTVIIPLVLLWLLYIIILGTVRPGRTIVGKG